MSFAEKLSAFNDDPKATYQGLLLSFAITADNASSKEILVYGSQIMSFLS